MIEGVWPSSMHERQVNFTDLLGAISRLVLYRLDPEIAHEWAILALRFLPNPPAPPDHPKLAVRVFGIDFPNPVGLGAGFDKDADVVDAMLRFGFGYAEVGTITPMPQVGNAGKRLYRLTQDQAIINRLGFPSRGHSAVHARLERRKGRGGIVGVNLGANKDTRDRVSDYSRGVDTFADVASYFTINVSSPNTPGLRDLQRTEALDNLLACVLDARDKVAETFGRKPVLLKIAPDLSLTELDEIVSVVRKRQIDGLIVSNTTVSRPPTLHDVARSETGGLSGRPLFDISTHMLAAAYLRVERQFPLIGVGGIDSAETAFAKIQAGASLVQFCSAFVFKGPALVSEIKRGLVRLLEEKSYSRLEDAVGAQATDWARA